MTIGFRILRRSRAVAPELVSAFASIPVSCVSDVMSRMSGAGPRLRPMHRGGVLAGPAFTVRTRPGDNLMVHAALERAAPGDVLVVDAGGDLTNAIVGELIAAYAVGRGIVGLVINGAIRDSAAIRQGGLPVYAAGVTHRGPYRDGPGEINVPVSLGGMSISPGDLILGDDDGLVSVPIDDAETVFKAAAAKLAAEKRQLADTQAGRLDRSWIARALTERGCAEEALESPAAITRHRSVDIG